MYYHYSTLCDIPNPIISEAASYLQQRDYINLSTVCRKLFIACNSPNSLQGIWFHCVGNRNYHPFNADLYPNAKLLKFDISQIEY